MGLSSSQARLLNLTARMHDIEYKAQNLEAQKLQMANESRHVYQEYEEALNRQKVQLKHIGADGSATYSDASIKDLIDAGYRINFINNAETELTDSGLNGKKAGEVVEVNNKTYYLTSDADATNKAKVVDITKMYTSKDALRNLVEAGFITFGKPDSTSETGFTEVNIATDTNLQEVTDEVDLKKAEAKYEADMRRIDAKDKKFDTDLAAMDNERNAIKTEMETLKSVAKENVDRTFKLFS